MKAMDLWMKWTKKLMRSTTTLLRAEAVKDLLTLVKMGVLIQDNSIASSIKKNPQSIQSSLKESILAKSKKRKINANKRQKEGANKTLTFVDMSRLSYLSKSVTADVHLGRKIDKIVAIPTSTKVAIMEDESEEDSDSDSV